MRNPRTPLQALLDDGGPEGAASPARAVMTLPWSAARQPGRAGRYMGGEDVQIDPVQQRFHIQRGNRKLDRPLRDGLRQRLHARDEPAPHRAPSSKRIHVHGLSWCGR